METGTPVRTRVCVCVLAPAKWLMEGGASKEITGRERTKERDALMCYSPEANQDVGTPQEQIPVFSRVFLYLCVVAVCISRASSD